MCKRVYRVDCFWKWITILKAQNYTMIISLLRCYNTKNSILYPNNIEYVNVDGKAIEIACP